MTATQNLSIRIAVVDGQKATREITQMGEQGQRAIEKIKHATAPASKGLLALNAVNPQSFMESRGQIMNKFGNEMSHYQLRNS